MSFNGADSIDGTSMDPSSNLGGSSGPHDITAGDIAVIVGAVVVFTLAVCAVLYYRQLQARRKRAGQLTEMEDVGGGGDHEDGGEEPGKKPPAPIWRYITWREKEHKEVGTRASTAQDVRADTQPTNETGAYHAV